MVIRSFSVILGVLLLGTLMSAPAAWSGELRPGAVQALDLYRSQGAGPFDAARAKPLWTEKHTGPDGKTRSCVSCHTSDPTQLGKHVKTGKKIDPLAPSVNPKRFTELKKIKKWFKRNCKWAWGRECTPQEKGDFLMYLKDL